MAEQSNVRVGEHAPQDGEPRETGPQDGTPQADEQQEEQQRRRPWWRRWRPELKAEGGPESIGITGVGVTGLVLAAVVAAVWWFVIHDAKVSVPNLTGLSQTSAEARLKEDELTVRQTLTEPSALTAGSVVRTDPPAGTKLAKGEGVVVYLAAPAAVPPSQPPTATVPPPAGEPPVRPLPQPPPPGGNQPTANPQPSAAPSVSRNPQANPQPNPQPNAEPQPEPRPVHIERDLVLGRYNWVDLDNGAYSPGYGGDLYFGQDANTQAFHLQPMSSGGADVVGTAPRTHETCANASTSTEEIAVDHLPVGTVVCVRTDENRLAAVEITGTSDGASGRNLHISYTTWEA